MTATADSSRFDSLAGLQKAHTDLATEVGKEVLVPDNAARVAVFVRRAVATGAALDDRDDRAATQALINFWTARLSSAAREAEREAVKRALSGESAGPRPVVPDLGDTLLKEFVPATLKDLIEAADAWLAGLPDERRRTVRRVLLRLTRLRPAGPDSPPPDSPSFDAVPSARAILWDVGPSAAVVNDVIAGLAAAGVVRVRPGETPEADQVALRSSTLIDDWPTLKTYLADRQIFRSRVDGWARRATEASPPPSPELIPPRLNVSLFGVTSFGEVVRWTAWLAKSGCFWIRRAARVFQPADAALLTGEDLEEVRTYADRTDAERRFIEASRYRELRGHKQSRILAAVFAGLVLVAATGWIGAIISKREAWRLSEKNEDFSRKMRIQKDALEMQTTAESTSNLAISLLLLSEKQGLTHAAKKLLIIQTLGHALFSPESVARLGADHWKRLEEELVKTGEPQKGPWFARFLRVTHKDEISRITSGRLAERRTVNDLRTLSSELRDFIVGYPESDAALATVRPVVLEQLALVAGRIAEATDRHTVEDIRAYRNVYWRLYTCEVVLLQEDAADGPLRVATEQFADALWKWEESPDGRASPAVVAELNRALELVREVSRPK